MPVLPCRANFSVDYKDIYQFLLACQQNCFQDREQFISISMEIESIDPLVVLNEIAQPNQLSFYFENKYNNQAIAAIDAVAKLKAKGGNRFTDTQKFIKSCLNNTITFGNLNHAFAGSHFFCIFGFFDENTIDYPFPAATVFLPKWQVARERDRCILVANLVIDAAVNLESLYQQFCQTIEKISLVKSTNKSNYKSKFQADSIDIANFKRSIVASLELINSHHLDKIVLAQALDVISSSDFNLFSSLDNLRAIHPNCYIFSTSNGKGQNFIGASPERLISIQSQELMTDALAGSAPRGKTPTEDAYLANNLLSSEKESREHKVVIDFITQSLKQLKIAPQLLPPQLRQLTNIQHLWTPISAKVPLDVHPLEIVAKLHPTPAVAGVAREIACEQIKRYESFERGLYAAPLGWVDYQGNSEFIVGIRSALMSGDRARLYAGAGIVAGSDPDKEIAEIQLKLQALLKALV